MTQDSDATWWKTGLPAEWGGEWVDKLVKESDYDTRLAITAWVCKNLLDHARDGGTYRYLIYDRLGFGPDAYAVLQMAGALDISNEFDPDLVDVVAKVAKEHNIEVIKQAIPLCDEIGCFNRISSGFPTSDGGYRRTCSEHFVWDK